MKFKNLFLRTSTRAVERAYNAGKIPQQLKSLFALFLLIIFAFLILRHTFVPETFGDYGHYRAAAVDSVLKVPIKYAGVYACVECHDDVYAIKSESRHRDVSCEVCHGPALAHTEDPGENVPPAPRDRAYCSRCHEYNLSRPTGFPQIEQTLHNPPKACITCHDPHDPKPPHTPEQCAACHADIARTKAVSHHAPLACTRCHDTPDAHKDQPRMVAPTKPSSRAFCGGCHGKDAESSRDIPRVDMVTHGVGYVCWQCHYPHYPEVR